MNGFNKIISFLGLFHSPHALMKFLSCQSKRLQCDARIDLQWFNCKVSCPVHVSYQRQHPNTIPALCFSALYFHPRKR